MNDTMDTLFADLRGLMQTDLLDAESRWRLWRILRDSHALEPDRHAQEAASYAAGFPHHFIEPLVTTYSLAQLELAAAAAPFATFELGAHFDSGDLAAALGGPLAAFVCGVSLVDEQEHLLELLSERQRDLVNLTRLDISPLYLEHEGAQRLLAADLLPRLTHLTCVAYDSDEDEATLTLLTSRQLGSLTHLYLSGSSLSARSLDALSRSPDLSGVIDLGLRDANLDDDAIAALASGSMSRLERLDLTDNYIGNEGIRALVKSTNFNHLTHLSLQDNSLENEGAGAFARSAAFPSLRHLDLSLNALGEAGLRALAHSSMVKRLGHLDLGDVTDPEDTRGPAQRSKAMVEALLEGDVPFELTLLNLEDNGMGADAVSTLAQSPLLPRLEHLDLCDNPISTRGLKGLGASTTLPSLTHLLVSRCRIGASGLRAISKSPAFASLVHLDLDGNKLTADDIRHLLADGALEHLRELDLSSLPIGADLPDLLRGRLSHLTSLRLSDVGLSARSLAALLDVDGPIALTSLDLSNNPLDDTHVASVLRLGSTLTRLEHLTVEDTEVFDESNVSIFDEVNLPSLRRLSADFTELFDAERKGARAHPGFAFVELV